MSDDTPTRRFDQPGDDEPTARLPQPTDAPTELLAPPPVPPTDAALPVPGDDGGRSRRLLIILISVGAALLIAVIVLLVLLLGRGAGGPQPSASPTPSQSASPSPTATSPSPSPTPSQTATAAPPPPSTAPSITSFAAGSNTVSCNAESPVQFPAYISFSWSTSNASQVYFGVDTNDASTGALFENLPPNGDTSDFPDGYDPFEFGCYSPSHTYTLTVEGSDGATVSESITITNTGDVK